MAASCGPAFPGQRQFHHVVCLFSFNRNNIRQYAFEGRHRNYIDNPSIHSIDTSVNSTVTTDLADNLKTSKTYFNFFDLTLKQGDFFRLAVED